MTNKTKLAQMARVSMRAEKMQGQDLIRVFTLPGLNPVGMAVRRYRGGPWTAYLGIGETAVALGTFLKLDAAKEAVVQSLYWDTVGRDDDIQDCDRCGHRLYLHGARPDGTYRCSCGCERSE